MRTGAIAIAAPSAIMAGRRTRAPWRIALALASDRPHSGHDSGASSPPRSNLHFRQTGWSLTRLPRRPIKNRPTPATSVDRTVSITQNGTVRDSSDRPLARHPAPGGTDSTR